MTESQRFTLSISSGRVANESEWDIPLTAPLYHWAVPIGIVEDGEVRRVGTAFYFSRLGHLMSARHCIDEALHVADRGIELGDRTKPARIAHELVVIRATDGFPDRVDALGVRSVTAPEPSDLAFVTTAFQTAIPQVTLPLSFALPDVGSTVLCFGFPLSSGGTVERIFPETLRAVEGTVKAYFPPGFTRGFMKGPCFVVSASVPHGMSGGPVVNQHGAVCGVVSAGAEVFMGEPTCLVTPLYIGILTEVMIHADPAPNVRISGSRTLIDLCAEGHVSTDGTEDRVHFREDAQGVEIGPIISRTHSAHVFDSYEEFQRGRNSSPVTEPRMRLVVNPNSDVSSE